MKVLLDEGVPQPLARFLSGHAVETVASMGWLSIKNGKLLRLVADEFFTAFITGDKNMAHQQSLVGRPFAVLVLSTINRPVIKQHLPAIVEAIDRSTPGTVIFVNRGNFVASRR